MLIQSCPTLCNPVDCSPPGSSVHGDSPGKNPGKVAMPSSRGSSWPRDQACISYVSWLRGKFFTTSATWEDPNASSFTSTLHHSLSPASSSTGISMMVVSFLPFVLLPQLNSLKYIIKWFQFSSVSQSCLTLCDPMNHSTSGLPVHHHLPEFTQTHVHRVSDAIQPSHHLSSPSPPSPNPSQHQSLFQWVNSSHEVAKVLEFQVQHHSLKRNPRADLL